MNATWEKLPTCQRPVADYGSLRAHENGCASPCGLAALTRVRWEDGDDWLYLCEAHALEVRAIEESLEETPPDDDEDFDDTDPDEAPEPCPFCDGTGWQNDGRASIECPECGGQHD